MMTQPLYLTGAMILALTCSLLASFVRDMPAGKAVAMSRGQISDEQLDELIASARSNPWSGCDWPRGFDRRASLQPSASCATG